MAIQSAILASTTLSSSDIHPKERSQFLTSIASNPVSVALSYGLPVLIVALGSSPQSRVTLAARSPSVSYGASNLYSWRNIEPCLGLVTLALSGSLCVLTLLPPPTSLPRCGRCSDDVPVPLVISLLLLFSLHASLSRVVRASPPPSDLPWHSVSLKGNSIVFLPHGQLFHSGVFGAPWHLNSPSQSMVIPPKFFRHSGGLGAPFLSPNT